jgi:hypothetical protein
MEPYYQLSKKNGALGKDSLLLHYPFSFLPLVPFKAFRDRYVPMLACCRITNADPCRHWPVFWASLAVVLVTWGLVPTQAGIFSVRSVTRTANTTFVVSTSYMPAGQQPIDLTRRYAQSTYGIVSLNETLPPYMTRNYTLAPFKPRGDGVDSLSNGTHTAPTTMYTLDLDCDNVSHKANGSTPTYLSTKGCMVSAGGPTGNLTMGDRSAGQGDALEIKQYTSQYIGWHYGNSVDWYLEGACRNGENTTFFATIGKSKVSFIHIPDVLLYFISRLLRPRTFLKHGEPSYRRS